MATTYVAKKDDTFVEPKIHRIRITLTSRNVKNLEKGTHFNPTNGFTYLIVY